MMAQRKKRTPHTARGPLPLHLFLALGLVLMYCSVRAHASTKAAHELAEPRASNGTNSTGCVIFSMAKTGTSIVALSVDDQAVKWSVPFGQSELIAVVPSLDGTVVFYSGESSFNAINASNGETVWSFPSRRVRLPKQPPPVLSPDGTAIYVPGIQELQTGDDYAVLALNATTGGVLWGWAVPFVTLPIALSTLTSQLFCLSGDRTLYALDLKTGAINWKTAPPYATGIAVDPIVLSPDESVGYYNAIDNSGPVTAFDTQNGSVKWTTQVQVATAAQSQVVTSDGSIVFTASAIHANVIARDAASGNVLWSADVPDFATLALSLDEDLLFAGFAALHVSNGTVKWTTPSAPTDCFYETSAPIPVISPDSLTVFYYCAWRGLYAINAQTGSILWHQESNNAIRYPMTTAIICPRQEQNVVPFQSSFATATSVLMRKLAFNPTCIWGTARWDGTGECRPCPVGTFAVLASDTPAACQVCPPGTFSTAPGQTSCTPCAAGTYQPSPNSTHCLNCPAGSISAHPASASCSVCPPGSFSESPGEAACRPCPLGHHQPRQNSTQCDACPAGTFSNKEGALTCRACGPGTIAPKSGAWICVPCHGGTFQPASNGTACSACPSGTSAKPGSSHCIECNPGTFSPMPGQATCTACEAGQFQPASNATHCRACPAGMNSQQGSTGCISCEPGTFSPSPGQPTCTVCEAGQFQPASNATHCRACPAGMSSTNSSTTCRPCNPGTFSPSPGQPTCKFCEAGQFQPASNATHCMPCPAGSVSPTGAYYCRNCEPGSYSPSPGQPTCRLCEAGWYQPNPKATECYECPAGSFSSGNGSSTCKTCWPGTFSPSPGQSVCTHCSAGTYQPGYNGTSCNLCPAGGFVANGTNTCRTCLPGSYSHAGSTHCILCKPGWYQPMHGASDCDGCPAGTFSNYQINSTLVKCVHCPKGTASGRHAATCSHTCPSQEVKVGHKCVQASTVAAIATPVSIVYLAIVGAALVAYFRRKRKADAESRGYMAVPDGEGAESEEDLRSNGPVTGHSVNGAVESCGPTTNSFPPTQDVVSDGDGDSSDDDDDVL